MLRFAFLFLMVISSSALFAQKTDSLKLYLEEARVCSDALDFGCAERNYKALLRLDPTNRSATAEYGILLSKYMNRRKEALPYLDQNLKNSKRGDTIPEALIEQGRCLHYLGRYDEAIRSFKSVLPYCTKSKAGNELRDLMNKYIQQCEYGQAHSESGDDLVLIHMNEAVNSEGSEYVPIYLEKESTVLFTSRRSSNGNVDVKDGKYYEEIYESHLVDDEMSTAQKVKLKQLSKLPQHASVASVSPDGSLLFLVINGKLFSSTYKNGELSDPVDLGPNINRSRYQNHICMTPDGKTVYFSSDSKDGFGGLDIWKSQLQTDGKWGPAENLGADVNTPDDEESPAIMPDGKTLYFSSRGHRGFGGYDLFRSDWDGLKFTGVVNLGAPVNSPGDDTYLILESGGTYGYFSSDRSSGFGDMDIYILVFPQPDQEFVCDFNGKISIDRKDDFKTSKTMLTAKVPEGIQVVQYSWKLDGTLLKGEKNASVELALNDGKKHLITAEVRVVDAAKVVLFCTEAEVEFKPEALLAVTTTTTVKEEKTNQNKPNDTKETPSLNTVYFDYDRSYIRRDAAEILRKNARILRENPEVKIELTGHADSRGTDEYNDALSDRRLQSVVNFLVSTGVQRSQIIAVSPKGEKELVNQCSDETTCTDDDHQKNRRVEFRLR